MVFSTFQILPACTQAGAFGLKDKRRPAAWPFRPMMDGAVGV